MSPEDLTEDRHGCICQTPGLELCSGLDLGLCLLVSCALQGGMEAIGATYLPAQLSETHVELMPPASSLLVAAVVI